MKKWDCWATAQSLVRLRRNTIDEMHQMYGITKDLYNPCFFLKTPLLTLDIAFYSAIIVHGRVTDSGSG